MEQLNRQLCKGNPDIDYFATLVMGDLDVKTGLLRLSSAGHPHPLVLRAGHPAADIPVGGLPVGIDAGSVYQSEEVQLQPADAVLLFSDGLPDSTNEDGCHYGIDAVRAMAGTHANCDPDQLLTRLEAGLDTFREGSPIADDISMLLLRFMPDTVSVSQQPPEPGQWQAA